MDFDEKARELMVAYSWRVADLPNTYVQLTRAIAEALAEAYKEGAKQGAKDNS